METVEKPPKMKLKTAADLYFAGNREANVVKFLTKEGREFYFHRDPRTGEAIKISQSQAEQL